MESVVVTCHCMNERKEEEGLLHEERINFRTSAKND